MPWKKYLAIVEPDHREKKFTKKGRRKTPPPEGRGQRVGCFGLAQLVCKTAAGDLAL
jgi:hypothetical protein